MDKINTRKVKNDEIIFGRHDSIESNESDPIEAKLKNKGWPKKVIYLRHFPNVEHEEVLKRYPCALVSDFLRQGYLYITVNYLAFHSNIFGYVTKLLIPLRSIEAITKEKTARIIPNAIGITTVEGKHSFSSFLTRDRTFDFMKKTWQQSKNDGDGPFVSDSEDFGSSMYSSDEEIVEDDVVEDQKPFTKQDALSEKSKDAKNPIKKSKLYYFIYYTAIILIIFLFMSSAILLHRIIKVHNKYSDSLLDENDMEFNGKTVKKIIQQRPDLVTDAIESINRFVGDKLNHVSTVRKALESLDSLVNVKTDDDPID